MTTIKHDQATQELIDSEGAEQLLTGLLGTLGLTPEAFSEGQRAHFTLLLHAHLAGVCKEAMRKKTEKYRREELQLADLALLLDLIEAADVYAIGHRQLMEEADRYL